MTTDNYHQCIDCTHGADRIDHQSSKKKPTYANLYSKLKQTSISIDKSLDTIGNLATKTFTSTEQKGKTIGEYARTHSKLPQSH